MVCFSFARKKGLKEGNYVVVWQIYVRLTSSSSTVSHGVDEVIFHFWNIFVNIYSILLRRFCVHFLMLSVTLLAI